MQSVIDFVNGQHPQVESGVFTIGREEAQELLKRNIKNRRISDAAVNDYAKIIANGRWFLNAQTIVFNEDGQLADGQHRLLAIEKVDKPVQVLVACGVSREAFATYDCGRRRNVAQLMQMQGTANYIQTSAIVTGYSMLMRGYHQYDAGGVSMCQENKLSNEEAMRLYNNDKESFDCYGSFAKKFGKEMRMPPLKSTTLCAHWKYLVDVKGYDFDYVRYFFEQLYSRLPETNNTTLRAICKMFRKWHEEIKRLPTSVMIDYIVKAWNLYATGREVSAIVLPRDGSHPEYLSKSQAESLK